MARQYKQMKGEEFVRKILAGETDFTGIELEENFSITGYGRLEQLNHILQQHNHSDHPFCFNYSRIRNVEASGLSMPGFNAIETDFGGTALDRSDLAGANLKAANLAGASLSQTDLRMAFLRYAEMCRTDLNGTDLRGADLYKVKNLKAAENIGKAIYNDTIVDPENMAIIKTALDGSLLRCI